MLFGGVEPADPRHRARSAVLFHIRKVPGVRSRTTLQRHSLDDNEGLVKGIVADAGVCGGEHSFDFGGYCAREVSIGRSHQ